MHFYFLMVSFWCLIGFILRDGVLFYLACNGAMGHIKWYRTCLCDKLFYFSCYISLPYISGVHICIKLWQYKRIRIIAAWIRSLKTALRYDSAKHQLLRSCCHRGQTWCTRMWPQATSQKRHTLLEKSFILEEEPMALEWTWFGSYWKPLGPPPLWAPFYDISNQTDSNWSKV